ncbi:helix-turn-helix domain-containing protein [Fusibacter sp. JL216-2]|uniref:helix-turn-helix domain-containing protein n=1 Tax=Fusibacter sp. JL216-2 TaxID=3071453 RepID=UPI003D3308ED
MDIKSVFANNVKKYRTKKGLSQEAFAEKAGLHRTYISAIEREKRSIALENIQKIADALEIETYLLFIYIEPEKKKGGRLGNEKL